VLLQLLRGGGLPGIAAMSELAAFANGWLARPLLSRSRAELEAWVRESGLTWVEDDTNVDESLDRNYLRRRILPPIRERWPGSATAVARSAGHAAEAQALLNTIARFDVERASYGESLSVKTLRALPLDRRRNALRFWIMQAGWMAPDTRRLEELAGPLFEARPDANPFVEWDALQVGVCGRAGIRVRVQRYSDLLSLSPTVTSLRPALTSNAGRMRQTRAARVLPSLEIVWSWRDSRACELPDDLGKLELEPDDRGPINLDALPYVLTVRWRRGGERLSPRRSGPRRALKNLLQEAHVPVAERGRLPLLFSVAPSSAKLIAVADLLLDKTVQATSATRRRARLRWKKSPRESV